MTSKDLHRVFKNINYKNECSVCKRIPESSKKRHTLVKIGKKVNNLCDTCLKSVFLTENSRTKFLPMSKSDKDKLKICQSCHKTFSLKKCVKKQSLSAKGENTQLLCEVCVEKLSIKENLKRQGLSYNKNLICKFNKEVFSSKEKLNIHHSTHIEKYEVCKVCKMKINSVRSHHSQLCGACEENLLIKKTLKQHCLSHKDREIERKLSKTILKMHCLVLVPNTPFVCGICKDGFSSKEELLQHYPVHTGEKSHEWTNCKENHSLFKEDNYSQMNGVYF